MVYTEIIRASAREMIMEIVIGRIIPILAAKFMSLVYTHVPTIQSSINLSVALKGFAKITKVSNQLTLRKVTISMSLN
jgi:hypothetical protein